jgi:hypothetical protein
MRRITITALVLLAIAEFAALALPQQPTFQASMMQMPQGKRIGIVAQNIQRDGAVLHATGNVQVRIPAIAEGEDRIVIHSQEVIYHADTGEIETRGDARITIEKAQ